MGADVRVKGVADATVEAVQPRDAGQAGAISKGVAEGSFPRRIFVAYRTTERGSERRFSREEPDLFLSGSSCVLTGPVLSIHDF
jgi:hypothetical protein